MAEAIKVVGLAEVQRALKRLEVPTKEISQAGQEAARIVANYAKEHTVPVRTGKLRDAIRAAKVQRGAVVQVSGIRVPYANPIHFGWFRRHILPQPFIYAALDQRIGEVYDAYFAQLDKLVKRVAGSPNLTTPTNKPKPKGEQGHIKVLGPSGWRNTSQAESQAIQNSI